MISVDDFYVPPRPYPPFYSQYPVQQIFIKPQGQFSSILDAVLPQSVNSSPQWPDNLVAAFAPADWFANNFFLSQFDDLYFDDYSFEDSFEDSSEESNVDLGNQSKFEGG